MQIAAQLIAPLWLAWGLIELVGKGVAVRFGAKLITAALTFVAVVVLVTDPLSSTTFGKTWPAAAAHYQIIPKSLLNLVAAVTVLTVVIALAVLAGRVGKDPAWRRVMVAASAAGVAAVVILGLRLNLPASEDYAALCGVCALLTWLAGVQAGQIDLAVLRDEVAPEESRRAVRGGRDRYALTAESQVTGDGSSRYRDDGDDRFMDDSWYRPASRPQRNGGYPGGDIDLGTTSEYLRNGGYQPNGTHRPDVGFRPDGGNEMNGLQGGDPGRDPDQPSRLDRGFQPENGYQPQNGYQSENGHRPDEVTGGLADADADADVDRTGVWRPRGLGREAAAAGTAASAGAAGPPVPADAEPARPAAEEHEVSEQNYGLIAIYTLADNRVAEFDALAERVVDDVRASEPDVLVYAVHTVPNAPMQRIFYEVYRDRRAYEEHRRQAYLQRFEVERTPYVLATNVIELGMQQGKLSAPPGLSQLFGRSPGR
ncbi:MAG TPA: antibiotic biosynthesis monooxygenase [Streptosporangiaceae bacterium]